MHWRSSINSHTQLAARAYQAYKPVLRPHQPRTRTGRSVGLIAGWLVGWFDSLHSGTRKKMMGVLVLVLDGAEANVAREDATPEPDPRLASRTKEHSRSLDVLGI